ncbi:MAG: M12 family metallo-peptidase, partial [Rudaea sp.]
TTIYRTTATDPYASGTYAATDVPADGTDLSNFGNYWQANYSTPGPNYITRSFAVLLSGLGPCSGGGCSASGIAWINSYCQNASSGGSYAVVQVFSNISFDPDGSGAAGLYDHELGHNFGADHTHCTDATTGQYAVATNTIDICYNGEGTPPPNGPGCYGGATTICPAGGAGTIMSYCDIAACAQSNIRAFSPIQISAVAPYGVVADSNAAPAGCLNTTDDIFYDGFEQPGG